MSDDALSRMYPNESEEGRQGNTSGQQEDSQEAMLNRWYGQEGGCSTE